MNAYFNDEPPGLKEPTDFFRAWLLTEMRRRNVRAEQLAHCSQVHRSTISRLLRGDRSPTLDTVVRLAAAFGVDIAQTGPWAVIPEPQPIRVTVADAGQRTRATRATG